MRQGAGVFCIDGKYITVGMDDAGVFCVDGKYINVITWRMLVHIL